MHKIKKNLIWTIVVLLVVVTLAMTNSSSSPKNRESKNNNINFYADPDLEVPIGTIMAWAGSQALLQSSTTEWLICDGSKIPRSRFPDLCDILSDNWGPITGLNNDEYTLPDLRGVFLRGVNQDRGGQYADPDLNLRKKWNGESYEGIGSFQTDQIKKHNHSHRDIIRGKRSNWAGGPNVGPIMSEKTTIGDTGGAETRPRNAYVYFIIKAK